MTGAGLPELVAKAFESACDTDSMAEFLADVANFFGARKGAIVISPLSNPSDILPITFGIDPERIRNWFGARNQTGTVYDQFATLRPGDTVLDDGRNHDRDYWSTHLVGGVVSVDDYNRCFMALWREAGQPPFSEPEVETLRALIGYFRRAINVNTRFVGIYSKYQDAISVLEQSPRAIIILGQNGQPTYQNLEAIRILSKNDGLAANESKIMIDDDDAREKVSAFLEQIRRTAQPGQFSAHRLATVVPRKSGDPPYKLIAYALPFERSQAMLHAGQGLAVLLLFDQDTHINLNTSLLHNFYNLTQAEAALSQSLFIGNSLPEASDHLGISVNTTRTQLRSIFKKVGVHSQAALLQEFAKFVGPG